MKMENSETLYGTQNGVATLRHKSVESPFISWYWGSRKESREECLKRCLAFLQGISFHPDLKEWFDPARSKKQARRSPVEISGIALDRRLHEIRGDADGGPMPGMGYSFGMWNGNFERPATLSVHCGAYFQSGENLQNSVFLDLPGCPEVGPSTISGLRKLLLEGIEVWNPDRAAVSSPEFRKRVGETDPYTLVGWLVYNRDPEGKIEEFKSTD
jgi:hypothetical protein